ncbi:MAG: rhodanese-like domain-containing protein [Dehalococcoidia bacterium]
MAIKNIFGEVAKVRETVESIGIEELKAELESNPDLLLVDIREIQERVDLGTIPGAKHAPRGMLEFWADPASRYYRDWFREDRRTILFCAAGGRSVLAAKAMQDLGFKNVAEFAPGFNGWKEAGEDVEDVSATSRWVRRTG